MRAIVTAVSLTLMAAALPRAQEREAAQIDMSVPQLVGCWTEPRPFFRTSVFGFDGEGKPAKIPIIGSGASKGFRAFHGAAEQQVIYVSTGGATSAYVILLLDTSGSMNNALGSATRFDTAKRAIGKALQSFDQSSSNVAVIPFDSRNVRARIQSASFSSNRSEVQKQVDGIPKPTNDLNTGLYTAIDAALGRLAQPQRDGSTVALIVFSDGANDVGHPKDDPDLSSDLPGLRDTVRKAGIPIFTVGFTLTEKPAIDALRSISDDSAGRYYDANSQEQLTDILQNLRRRFTDRVDLLVGPVADSRSQIGGTPFSLSVTLNAGGATLQTPVRAWNNPGIGDVTPSVDCTPAERDAILHVPPPLPPPDSPLKKLIVLLTYAAVLAGLWFGAPRFMWPEAYVPRPVIPTPPPAPNIPGLSVPPPPTPQLRRPTMPPRPSAPQPPASPSLRPTPQPDFGAPDQTVMVPPRNPARPPAPPRAYQPPSTPYGGDDRDSGDETVYVPPPNKNPPKR